MKVAARRLKMMVLKTLGDQGQASARLALFLGASLPDGCQTMKIPTAGQIARIASSLAAQIRSLLVSPPAAWVVKATSQ